MREIDRRRADMDFLQIDEPRRSGAIDDEVARMGVSQRHGERLIALGEGQRHAAHQAKLLGDLGARPGIGHGLVEEAHGILLDRFKRLDERILLARNRHSRRRQ